MMIWTRKVLSRNSMKLKRSLSRNLHLLPAVSILVSSVMLSCRNIHKGIMTVNRRVLLSSRSLMSLVRNRWGFRSIAVITAQSNKSLLHKYLKNNYRLVTPKTKRKSYNLMNQKVTMLLRTIIKKIKILKVQ